MVVKMLLKVIQQAWNSTIQYTLMSLLKFILIQNSMYLIVACGEAWIVR